MTSDKHYGLNWIKYNYKKGETLHSLLKIPCTNSEKEQFLPLENDNLKKLQNEFKKIEFLIIDEFSFVLHHFMTLHSKHL